MGLYDALIQMLRGGDQKPDGQQAAPPPPSPEDSRGRVIPLYTGMAEPTPPPTMNINPDKSKAFLSGFSGKK